MQQIFPTTTKTDVLFSLLILHIHSTWQTDTPSMPGFISPLLQYPLPSPPPEHHFLSSDTTKDARVYLTSLSIPPPHPHPQGPEHHFLSFDTNEDARVYLTSLNTPLPLPPPTGPKHHFLSFDTNEDARVYLISL